MSETFKGPIIVGGLGGSGTRVVADILMNSGIYMGSDLNESLDNLWSVLLFKRPDWFQKTNPEGIFQALKFFETAMTSNLNGRKWGWKDPCSHIYLKYIAEYFPDFRFIYVIRHGLDMAFTSNHVQVRDWGFLYEIPFTFDLKALPRFQLKYWIKSNQKAIERGKKLEGKFFVLKFEDLFGKIKNLEIPSSVGRYKNHDLSIFPPEDIEAVREFGYDI